ncbi:MAG: DUF6106 family protein [Oscillospiraceae bacterium]
MNKIGDVFMQDVFIEYIVKRKKDGKDFLIQLFITISTFAVAGIILFLSPILGAFSFFGVAILAGITYLALWLIRSRNIEFEYILTNGELDFDKIIAKSKRKRILTLKCKEFESFGRFNKDTVMLEEYKTKFYLCDSLDGENIWYAGIKHPTNGKTIVVFNANKKMLDGMRNFLPRNLVANLTK